MVERQVIIQNRNGIHARPASLLVKTASSFESQIFLEKDGDRINGKSILGIIALGATYQTPIKIVADGPDEEEAARAIEQLFNSKFEE
jgi:phosphocarrier protein